MLRQAATLLLLLFAACGSSAQDSVVEWLAKMDASRRSLSYEGILSYQYANSVHELADQIYGLKVRHYIKNGLGYDYVATLDGPEQEIAREGHNIRRVHVGPKLIQRTQQSSQRGYQRYYDVDISGADRVAGREVVRLEIRPKDVYRLGYLLSLDTETGLLLRSEAIDQQGRVLERFQYMAVNLEPSLPPELAKQDVNAVQIDAVELEAGDDETGAAALPWRPSWLPIGFIQTQGNGHPESLSYTDGMAVFSIFVDSLMAANQGELMATESSRRRGASVSYTATLPDQQALVTVVGEVPLLTAKQVAKSVVWVEQNEY